MSADIWFEAVQNGQAWTAVGDVASDGSGNPIGIQLWNPTIIGSTPISPDNNTGPVVATIRSVSIYQGSASANGIHAQVFPYNTALASLGMFGASVSNFPITAQNISQVQTRVEQSVGIGAIVNPFKRFDIPSFATFTLPEWVYRLMHGDPAKTGQASGNGLLIVIPNVTAGVHVGVTFEWIETTP